MKKNKIICLVSALIMTLSCTSLFGCQKDDEVIDPNTGEVIDLTKTTTLQITVFDGGLGVEWIKQVGSAFRQAYKDVSFEEGKTGVYVEILPKKEQLADDLLREGLKLKNETSDLYYTSSTDITSFAESGVMADITDIVTEDIYDSETREVSEDGELSILDKMDPFYAETMNLGTKESPKYYCLPFEDCIYGLVYNHSLFEDNNWLTYSGLYGLPKTTAEFYDLLNRIYNAGYTCFTYAPNDAGFYAQQFNLGFVGQYEGYEAANLNLTFDGEYTFSGDTEPTEITPENAWMLKDQQGKKELVYFLRRFIDKKYYSNKVTSVSYPFADAQNDFVMGRLNGGSDTVAMLLEGEWWENEARDNFTTAAKRGGAEYGYGGEESDFRFMPIPQAPGGKNEKYTFGGNDGTLLFVNKNSEKKDLIKKWLQFAFSESALETFTLNTGVTLAFNYELDESQRASLTPFARSTYDIKKGMYKDQCEVVRVCSHYYENEYSATTGNTMGGFGHSLETDTPGGGHYTNLWNAFVKYDATQLPADDVFASWDKQYNQSDWEANYQAYLDALQ